ncbi:hypothetical protein LguiB_027879 [Lonicera macranthoides]
MSTSSSSKKRKAKQSQTQTPTTKNPQPKDDQKCQETAEPVIIVPYIPAPIVIDILSRTPIKTLFNCRLVCKNWASFTSTPEFAQLHLSRSPTSCLINPHLESLQSEGVHLVDLVYPVSPSNKLVFVPKINFPDVPIRLFNSCNGLVCLSQVISSNFGDACNIYVCNPILREFIILPKPPHVTKFLYHPCTFGFSRKTNQYKVVLSSYCIDSDPNSPNYQTYIYTLGECSWRRIGNYPYCIRNDNFYAFLNGALHWIPWGLNGPFICYFDFASEQFGEVPEPSENQVRYGKEEYGVKESWSKDIVITRRISNFDSYELIMINGNGKILMIFNKKSIIIYDLESKAFESELQIFAGFRSEFEAIAHVPSLISLKDVAKGSNLKLCWSLVVEVDLAYVVHRTNLLNVDHVLEEKEAEARRREEEEGGEERGEGEQTEGRTRQEDATRQQEEEREREGQHNKKKIEEKGKTKTYAQSLVETTLSQPGKKFLV